LAQTCVTVAYAWIQQKDVNRTRELAENHRVLFWRAGVNTSVVEAVAIVAEASKHTLTVELAKSRKVAVALDWFPRLEHTYAKSGE
jgi:hypothetical protein